MATITKTETKINVVHGPGTAQNRSIGPKTDLILPSHVCKQMSWGSLVPLALQEVHLRLVGGDVAGALEQMKVLVSVAKETSIPLVLPDTALSEHRLLVRTLAPALRAAGDQKALLSPTLPGEGTTYDRGESIAALYYDLAHLSILVNTLQTPSRGAAL